MSKIIITILPEDLENAGSYGDIFNCLLATAIKRQRPWFRQLFLSVGGDSLHMNCRKYYISITKRFGISRAYDDPALLLMTVTLTTRKEQ